jgi:FkbM family methyltransferase
MAETVEFGGWHFPSHEHHLQGWLSQVNDRRDGRLRYQGKKLDAALRWCKDFRTAVDVGAHVGLMSFYLAKQFSRVVAFEPIAEHRECFARNVDAPNVTLYDCALGEQFSTAVSMHTTQGSSGDSWVKAFDGDIEMKSLDDFKLQDVDFIKLDCEGFELFALRGAEETLKRCRPCVMVEQKPGKATNFGLKETEAVDYLRSLGAHLRTAISGDYILAWD